MAMDFMKFLAMGGGNLKFEITASDLADFGKAIAQQVIDAFQKKLEDAEMEARRRDAAVYLTTTQLCEKLGVTKSTLWHWRQRGILTPVKVGGQNRYDPNAVKRLLGQKKEKAEEASAISFSDSQEDFQF